MVGLTWTLTYEEEEAQSSDETDMNVTNKKPLDQQVPLGLTSSPLTFCTDRSSLDTIWRMDFTNMS